MKVKWVSKIWVRMSTTNIHLLQFKIKSFVKTRTLNAEYQDSYERETI